MAAEVWRCRPAREHIGSRKRNRSRWEYAMRGKARFVAALLFAVGSAASVVLAPEAGAQGAESVINGLEDQGYNVMINWTNGFDRNFLRRKPSPSVGG